MRRAHIHAPAKPNVAARARRKSAHVPNATRNTGAHNFPSVGPHVVRHAQAESAGRSWRKTSPLRRVRSQTAGPTYTNTTPHLRFLFSPYNRQNEAITGSTGYQKPRKQKQATTERYDCSFCFTNVSASARFSSSTRDSLSEKCPIWFPLKGRKINKTRGSAVRYFGLPERTIVRRPVSDSWRK